MRVTLESYTFFRQQSLHRWVAVSPPMSDGRAVLVQATDSRRQITFIELCLVYSRISSDERRL